MISAKADPENTLWGDYDKDPEGWLWKKTAIKQMAKLLPKSKSLSQALALDSLSEIGTGSVYLTKGGDLKFIKSDKAKAAAIVGRKQKKSNDSVAAILGQRSFLNNPK